MCYCLIALFIGWGCLYSAVLSYTAPVTWGGHRFYQDISKLSQPEEDGSMSITTTMDEINAKILSLNYGDLKAEIKSVDAQESLNGGVKCSGNWIHEWNG
ncbi:putative Ras GTPase-activating protein-binding protein [Helianthus debilis subsp. tardiflorus]